MIRHYPSYTPQLNKVENQWLNIRGFTANRLFGSLDEAKNSYAVDCGTGGLKLLR